MLSSAYTTSLVLLDGVWYGIYSRQCCHRNTLLPWSCWMEFAMACTVANIFAQIHHFSGPVVWSLVWHLQSPIFSPKYTTSLVLLCGVWYGIYSRQYVRPNTPLPWFCWMEFGMAFTVANVIIGIHYFPCPAGWSLVLNLPSPIFSSKYTSLILLCGVWYRIYSRQYFRPNTLLFWSCWMEFGIEFTVANIFVEIHYSSGPAGCRN